MILKKEKVFPNFGDFSWAICSRSFVRLFKAIKLHLKKCVADEAFTGKFRSLYDYIGRPSSLHKAERLTEHCGVPPYG